MTATATGAEVTKSQAAVLRWAEGLVQEGIYPSVDAMVERGRGEGATPSRSGVEEARRHLKALGLFPVVARTRRSPDPDDVRRFRRAANPEASRESAAMEAKPPEPRGVPGEFRADCRKSAKILAELRAYRDQWVREREAIR